MPVQFSRQILLYLLMMNALLFASEHKTNSMTDEQTAFMWQDAPVNRSLLLTWNEAKTYCDELKLDGFDDWWLPSESEMMSIVNLKRPQGRRIKAGFTYYKGAAYWTSGTYAWNAPHAWVVDFGTGSSFSLEKSQRRYVRCVRCNDFQECIERFYNK